MLKPGFLLCFASISNLRVTVQINPIKLLVVCDSHSHNQPQQKVDGSSDDC